MIKEEIRELIKKNLVIEDEANEINDSDNIFEMGYVNSLFAMKLVNYIEDEYDIIIDNEDLNLQNFFSVDAITAFIKSKM
ncbi:phosphopantetheine-binding protein [Sellimonas intestinalis]|uniref:phosphopantetheine-binding protein n=1 Tax=Sellimonas intestinalis TaxID=1653434 RepID=UPI0015ECC56A|nr:phosphopantetheine-binding protein [Sellimonas intestinalis]MBA2213307.1 acyl carrier protein [Sellimonas intestinalis]